MKYLRKLNAMMRYELINLRRGILIWVIAVLYAIGIEQVMTSMFSSHSDFISLVGLIKVSWLPLNFIMLPLMLLSLNVGYSKNDVFDTLDISPGEVLMSKVLAVSVVNGLVLGANLLITVVIGIINRVSIGYFLYETAGYALNTIIFLLVTGSIGLFIGQVLCKRIGVAFSFILIIVLFIVLCNFYKLYNFIIPVINIRMLPGIFDVISYDKVYACHNILWTIISFILLLITYIHLDWRGRNVKLVTSQTAFIAISAIVSIMLIIEIAVNQPTFYDMGKRSYDDKQQKYISEQIESFFSKADVGYYVEKYKMNMNIDSSVSNDCDIDIRVKGENVKALELGLYKKLKISKVEVDGELSDYHRTSNSFIVKLPKEYKQGELIKLKVAYSGIINTTWVNGEEVFFVRNTAMFLGELFEWYPKLNDLSTKEFSVDINYKGKNKIYSNLNGKGKSGSFKFSGKSNDIFLISGNIAERNYKGYTFIGNEEYINNDNECDMLLTSYPTLKSGKAGRVILAPRIPGGSSVSYEGAYICNID